MNNKVLVAMSGGVDSSVTAALLKNQGFEVIGLRLQFTEEVNPEGFQSRCCAQVDSKDVKRICEKLDIPLHRVNVQAEFEDKVVDYFVHEYLQCRIPNPCIPCNMQIKIKFLLEKANELDCNWIATGHYAQVIQNSITGIAHLHKAVDARKDQSFLLSDLTQDTLRRTMMPLGSLTLQMVEKLAAEFGLQTSSHETSQEACFVGKKGYIEFVEKRAADTLRPVGPIRRLDGTQVGNHQGFHRFVLGQKKGFDIDVKDPDLYCVVDFDIENKTLIVGEEKELYRTRLLANQVSWIRPVDGLRGIRCKVQIQSHEDAIPCRVTSFEAGRIMLEFEDPQRDISPGLRIVFYQGDEILGGAFIERISPPAKGPR